MKELRELLAKAVPGEWHYDGMHDEITSNQAKNYWVANDICIDEVCEREYDQFGHSYSPTLDLICAMHNALPELLDAWEMVQALGLANQISWEHLRVYTAWWEGADELFEQVLDYCKTCLFHGDCKDEPCGNPWKHRYEWLAAWRDAQRIEGVE